MTTILDKSRRVFGIPARMLAVWLAFLLAMWGSHGAARGLPALLAAVATAAFLWWRAARRSSRRGAVLLGLALLLALAPLAWVLVPMTASALGGLPANLEV